MRFEAVSIIFTAVLLLPPCASISFAERTVNDALSYFILPKHYNATSRFSNHGVVKFEARTAEEAAATKWAPPRVLISSLDVNDENKFCPESKKNTGIIRRPDFKGSDNICVTRINGNDGVNDFFSDTKQNKLKNEIIPPLISTLQSKILVTRLRGNVKPLHLIKNSICKHFNVPAEHSDNGVRDMDIVLYLATGPLMERRIGILAWAEKCETTNEQPLVAAVDVITREIYRVEITAATVNAILSALKVPSCKEGKALMPLGLDEAERNSYPKCIKVKCDAAESEIKMEYLDTNEWKDCPKRQKKRNGEFAPISMYCPTLGDVCGKPEWNRLYEEVLPDPPAVKAVVAKPLQTGQTAQGGQTAQTSQSGQSTESTKGEGAPSVSQSEKSTKTDTAEKSTSPKTPEAPTKQQSSAPTGKSSTIDPHVLPTTDGGVGTLHATWILIFAVLANAAAMWS